MYVVQGAVIFVHFACSGGMNCVASFQLPVSRHCFFLQLVLMLLCDMSSLYSSYCNAFL